jgi:flagellar hook-associated protein 2
VQSNSSQVTIAPGVTINLLAQSTSPVKVTVARSFSSVQSALSSLVSAYNAAFDALAQNRGQNGGALSGDSLVFTLTNVLRQVSQYQAGSGTISSLSNLGITLGDTGHLSLDTSALVNPNAAALSQFLGDTSSGGFLKAANDAVNGITDSTNGLVATDFNNLGDQITKLNTQVADQQSKITDLENNLQAQLSQADAAIATLQSQKTYFQELFQATYGTPSSGG